MSGSKVDAIPQVVMPSKSKTQTAIDPHGTVAQSEPPPVRTLTARELIAMARSARTPKPLT